MLRRSVEAAVRADLLKLRFPDAAAWQISAVGAKDARTPEGIRLAPAPALLGRLA